MDQRLGKEQARPRDMVLEVIRTALIRGYSCCFLAPDNLGDQHMLRHARVRDKSFHLPGLLILRTVCGIFSVKFPKAREARNALRTLLEAGSAIRPTLDGDEVHEWSSFLGNVRVVRVLLHCTIIVRAQPYHSDPSHRY